MKSIIIFLLILFPFLSFCQNQKLKLLDTEKGKKINLRLGDYSGLITSSGDTLEVHRYRYINNYRNPDYFNSNGMWRVTRIDNKERVIILTASCKKCGSRKYTFDEIEYIYFPKEIKTRHREQIFWLGIIGCSIGSIVEAISSKGKNWKVYGLLATVSISSSLYILGPGRKRIKSKKYKILD